MPRSNATFRPEWQDTALAAALASEPPAYSNALASQPEIRQAGWRVSMTMTLYRLGLAESAALRAIPVGPGLDEALEKFTDEAPWLDLGKSWDVIDHLLGRVGLADAGEEIGEPLHLGPARIIAGADAARLAAALQAVDLEALLARWSPEAVAGIYPRAMGDPHIGPAQLRRRYPPLRAFVSAAVEAGDGLLIEII